MQVRTKKSRSNLLAYAIVFGVFLFLAPFYYFDRMDLSLPSLAAATAIGLAILTRWKVRTRRWFWIAIAIIVAVHIVLIFRFPWNGERISSYVLGFYTLVDYGLILVFIWLIEVISRTPEESESRRRKTHP
jgi:hypothetical protein